MPKSGIFKKERLRPSQLRTIADRRFDDAQALRNTKQNARANGAMYLAGFTVECLLKAKLLERYSWLQSATSPEKLTEKERRVWSLCYRSHDLEDILGQLPSIAQRLWSLEQQGYRGLTASLRSVCARWTIHAWYSPLSAKMDDAVIFLNQIKDLKEWLK